MSRIISKRFLKPKSKNHIYSFKNNALKYLKKLKIKLFCLFDYKVLLFDPGKDIKFLFDIFS